ncbi:response regulator [Pseudomonas chlororaphis]|uniref:response regulator n=1 Tax=Pseudomonas chlororaphis TaxID=587753 RepID=UPI001E4EB566|nr:response regulator [Pseudomonas chlororaphis]MCB2254584.1 response regulator [Pseudomonas chlororaphis]
MPTKSLRILIFDSRHSQRLEVEKLLNEHGYYRIAPVEYFSDLLRLLEYTLVAFDLLVIHGDSVDGARPGFDLVGFCRNSPGVRHVLIYDDQSVDVTEIDWKSSQIIRKVSNPPSRIAVSSLMELIDPVRRIRR